MVTVVLETEQQLNAHRQERLQEAAQIGALRVQGHFIPLPLKLTVHCGLGGLMVLDSLEMEQQRIAHRQVRLLEEATAGVKYLLEERMLLLLKLTVHFGRGDVILLAS
jgi:hypothetical protein